jgi:hypothetical protein
MMGANPIMIGSHILGLLSVNKIGIVVDKGKGKAGAFVEIMDL